ncbi:hypothetical protein Vretifemale_20747 [Volvox reticuliferus]|uniref:Uncharacterized protein n=1 Tax=Volvox reticuliferus TaxID=1737510 RepID=A0A8J4D1H2_9CHLO|nr:hypothetical protein Vretifemale_20747 [Volvox reticuliferus]
MESTYMAGDPLMMEATSYEISPERMLILKPFCTTAFKQRVRLKGAGEDSYYATPDQVLQQAVSSHGRSMKELSDLADFSCLRMKKNMSMVRLQAEDYINHADMVMDNNSDGEGDAEFDGCSAAGNCSAGTVSAPNSSPNTPRACMTTGRTVSLRRDDKSSITGADAGGTHTAVNGGGAATDRKKSRYPHHAGGGAGSIAGGDNTTLAHHSTADGSHYAPDQHPGKGGGSELKLMVPGRAGAAASADQWARDAPRRPLPPTGLPPAAVNPRTTSIMSSTSPSSPRNNTTVSRRIDDMMSQLKRLDRTGSISGGSISGGGDAHVGPTPGPNWELRFARTSAQKDNSISCAGSVAEMCVVPCPVTPLLTDAFVQDCVSSLIDDAQSATSRPRFSSPGNAGGGEGRCSGGGGSQSCDGSSPRGRRSRTVKPSSSEYTPSGGASAVMALLNRGCMAWPTPGSTVRVAERWLYGRRVTRDGADAVGGGGDGLSTGTAPLRAGKQGQPASTSPRPPPAFDHGSRGVSPRYGCAAAEPVLRLAKNSATSSSTCGTGGGADSRCGDGTDGHVSAGGDGKSGDNATNGGSAPSVHSLALAVAVAEGRFIPPAGNVQSRSAPVTPRAPCDSSSGGGRGCGEGVGGTGANFAPVVGAISRPDSPAAAAWLFHAVTGSVPLKRDGEAVRPIGTPQELNKLRSFRIQASTSPRKLRNAKSGLVVRRSSSSSNFEIFSQRSTLMNSTKLPKLGVAFTEADPSAAAAETQPVSGGWRRGVGDEAGYQTAPHSALSRKAAVPGVGRCSSPGGAPGPSEADAELACRSAPQSPRRWRRKAGEEEDGLVSKMRILFDILSR